MNIKELLSMEKCDCGRSYCEYYSASENISYSREEVEEILKILPKLEKHLRKELSKKTN